MMDVVARSEPQRTAREATVTVAMLKRTPERRWDRPRPCTDFDDATIGVVAHHDRQAAAANERAPREKLSRVELLRRLKTDTCRDTLCAPVSAVRPSGWHFAAP
jgi:hypothetical protein